ncbi:MAG: choice-of-anchor tandem repeat GloVer-containing protein [Candidatus Sulfotelmatobacter sp.]|jgi:uncharacterized repeat protein (TIGR03803 family)
MKNFRISGVFGGFLFLVLSLSAQTFTTLHSFDLTDGATPFAGLIQATDGNLYGTTGAQGTNGGGTVFKITPGGTLTTLYSFATCGSCTDGYSPIAGLVQATNGDFYGTTLSGGVFLEGTVFKITPSGALTTLYSFCAQTNCTDGQAPNGLVQATDGNFYGTAEVGGANGQGTVFKITPSGVLTTLYSFCSQSSCLEGGRPTQTLIQGSDGSLYGTTPGFGANDAGTVFRITTSGALTTLYSFCAQSNCTDGGTPNAPLVQAANGSFYGETAGGGANFFYGTIFKITSTGTLTTLHSFDAIDGEAADGGLVQGSDGNFYGTTSSGGVNSGGTAFKITPSGTLTTLYSFCVQYPSCGDGQTPVAALVQDTNGVFYGTTELGGTDAAGTIFSLSVGLHPFVVTKPNSGRVGAAVKILGTNLTGVTSVTFNGTAATFTVVSRSEITTTVPTGATTGKVKVVTSGGTLTSNANFRVP